MKRFKPYKISCRWRLLMMVTYVEPFIIIDIEDDTYTIFTDEEIVKQIEAVNTRHYKKIQTEEEIAVAEQLLQDAINKYKGGK